MDGHDLFLFNRMVILSSKHYMARNFDGTVCSSGISYIRRTGSLLQDTCFKEFLDIIVLPFGLSTMKRELGISHYRFKNSIMSGSNREIFKIRSTKRGKTFDHIRVTGKNTKQVEFEYMGAETVDITYYVSILDSCLKLVCKCIMVQDISFIIDQQFYSRCSKYY